MSTDFITDIKRHVAGMEPAERLRTLRLLQLDLTNYFRSEVFETHERGELSWSKIAAATGKNSAASARLFFDPAQRAKNRRRRDAWTRPTEGGEDG